MTSVLKFYVVQYSLYSIVYRDHVNTLYTEDNTKKGIQNIPYFHCGPRWLRFADGRLETSRVCVRFLAQFAAYCSVYLPGEIPASLFIWQQKIVIHFITIIFTIIIHVFIITKKGIKFILQNHGIIHTCKIKNAFLCNIRS